MSITIPTVPTWAPGDVVTATKLQEMADGIAFYLNPPFCYVWNSVGGTANAGVWTPVGYDQEVHDPYGMHNNVTLNGRIVPDIDQPCRLELTSFCRLAGHDAGNAFPASTAHFSYQMQIRLNAAGSQTGGTEVYTKKVAAVPLGVTWDDCQVDITHTADYSPGDEYEVWVMQNSGLNLVIGAGVAVTGFQLRFAST